MLEGAWTQEGVKKCVENQEGSERVEEEAR